MDEEARTKKQPDFQIGQSLEELSVEELHALVAELKQEIVRLEKAAKDKSDHLSAAQSLLKN